MSVPEIQKAYEVFTREFLHPLLTGGTVRLGQPITPGMLENFALSRPSDLEVDKGIYDRLHWYAGAIAPVRSIPWPSRGLMAVAAACHNLAYVTDPSLNRLFARATQRKLHEYVDWFITQAGPPNTRGEALARHAVLERFLELRRVETTATNWAFTHSYVGRPLPLGFLSKPRWVEITKKQWDVRSLLVDDENQGSAGTLLLALAARSPVTQLLRTDRFGTFQFGTANLAVLSDDLIRHGIARVLAALGKDIQSVFGNALESLYRSGPPPSLLYYPLALIYEAHVIGCIDESSTPTFDSGSDPGSALFAAILPALVGAPDDLGAVLELDPHDLRVVRARAAELDSAIEPGILKLAIAIVDQATPPPLDHERNPIPNSTPQPEVYQ